MKKIKKEKVLIIVGPTASGKTSLSIESAKKWNGEIISADSRQVYRGLNLGTGKVTVDEMDGVQHHLLDVADPQSTYTVHDFVRDGTHAIEDIVSREKLPIIAGGTFLYIDALCGRISIPEVKPNEELRRTLETKSNEELLRILTEKNEVRARSIDTQNRRRLVRAIEIATEHGFVPDTHSIMHYNILTLGINITQEELNQNIYRRILKRISEGMIEEVRTLREHGLSYGRMEDLGLEYRYIARFLQEQLNKEEMISLLGLKTRQYAKRQITWLKRDKTINWVDKNDKKKVQRLIQNFLDS